MASLKYKQNRKPHNKVCEAILKKAEFLVNEHSNITVYALYNLLDSFVKSLPVSKGLKSVSVDYVKYSDAIIINKYNSPDGPIASISLKND